MNPVVYAFELTVRLFNSIRAALFGRNGVYSGIKRQLMENREWECE